MKAQSGRIEQVRGVWVSLIVGIIALAGIFYVYSTNVTVRKTHVSIQYDGSASGYLTTAETYPGFTVGGIKQHRLHLSLQSNATSQHQITSIQVNTVGFTILSVTPPTPIAIPAQTQALSIDLLLQAPFLGYDGDLDLIVVTV